MGIALAVSPRDAVRAFETAEAEVSVVVSSSFDVRFPLVIDKAVEGEERGLGLHVSGEQSGCTGFILRSAAVHGVPPCDAGHFLGAEPEAIEVVCYHSLNKATASIIVRRGNSYLT